MNEPILVQALAALAPVREHLVVVGGTAHRLFPLHVYGEALDHELLTTEDVDLAAPLQLAQAGGEDLAARLRAAGFEAEVRGAEEPCHRYRFGQTIATLQFIAPLQGSGLNRSGRRDRSLRFSGIVAEKLRSVELLLDAPWPLELDEFFDKIGFHEPPAFFDRLAQGRLRTKRDVEEPTHPFFEA